MDHPVHLGKRTGNGTGKNSILDLAKILKKQTKRD
jgi:hypothetical protein